MSLLRVCGSCLFFVACVFFLCVSFGVRVSKTINARRFRNLGKAGRRRGRSLCRPRPATLTRGRSLPRPRPSEHGIRNTEYVSFVVYRFSFVVFRLFVCSCFVCRVPLCVCFLVRMYAILPAISYARKKRIKIKARNMAFITNPSHLLQLLPACAQFSEGNDLRNQC